MSKKQTWADGIRHALECLDCGDVIYCVNAGDFVPCFCGKNFIDETPDYVRATIKPNKLHTIKIAPTIDTRRFPY